MKRVLQIKSDSSRSNDGESDSMESFVLSSKNSKGPISRVKNDSETHSSAAELAKTWFIHSSIHSTSQLYWHKMQNPIRTVSSKAPSNSKKIDFIYWPCILLKPLDHNILSSDNDSDDEEVFIEYIQFTNQSCFRHNLKLSVTKRRLVPYYGIDQPIDRSRWSPTLCKAFVEQWILGLEAPLPLSLHTKPHSSNKTNEMNNLAQSNRNIQAELFFLDKLLFTLQGKQRQNPTPRKETVKNHDQSDAENVSTGHPNRRSILTIKSSTSDSDSDESDDSSFEEPYTQALGNIMQTKRVLLEDSENSEEEREKNRRFYNPTLVDSDKTGHGSPKKKEPIRPGDVISYYSRIYRWGDERGKRVATVLSVDPNRSPILVLDNGDYLPEDTKVQRIKIPFRRTVQTMLVKGKLKKIKETIFVEHPGMFRCIEDFKLKVRNSHVGLDTGIQAEVKRMRSIIQKHNNEMEEKGQELLVNGNSRSSYKLRKESNHDKINSNDPRNKNSCLLSSEDDSSVTEKNKRNAKKINHESNSSPQLLMTVRKKKVLSLEIKKEKPYLSSSASSTSSFSCSSSEKIHTTTVSRPKTSPILANGTFRLKRYTSTPRTYPIDFEETVESSD